MVIATACPAREDGGKGYLFPQAGQVRCWVVKKALVVLNPPRSLPKAFGREEEEEEEESDLFLNLIFYLEGEYKSYCGFGDDGIEDFVKIWVADFLVIIGSVFFEVFFTEFGIVVVGV